MSYADSAIVNAGMENQYMAQKMQILYTDDLGGGEAAGTVLFAYNGTEYEIDLSQKNTDKFAQALGPFIESARRTSGGRHRAGKASSAAPRP